MKKIIIDIPDSFDEKHLLQEKYFEYINSQNKMARDYTILWRTDKPSSKYIKEMIDDWIIPNIEFSSVDDSNMAKVACIKEMVNEADESLCFFDFSLNDIESKIMVNHCANSNKIYSNVVRLDWGNKIY